MKSFGNATNPCVFVGAGEFYVCRPNNPNVYAALIPGSGTVASSSTS
jgi:hypothetical protein